MKTKTELEKMRSDVAAGQMTFVVAVEQSALGVITFTSYVAGQQRVYERLEMKPIGELFGVKMYAYKTKKRTMVGHIKAEWTHRLARALLLT